LVKELPFGGGRLVVGVNPQRPFDEQHRSFLDLVADQLATAVANARAYEEERKRAEALAELDRAKTTFFSNVSHEFRTPLTLLLGPVEDGLADATCPLPPAQRERQEVVRRNALRLLKMVNSLLDFSRIEAGRSQAAYEPTDLATYTADLASTFRSTIEKAGLRLAVDAPPLGELVYVDREMWEKVVLNLLSNAFKFTLDGEIAVSVRPGDGYVELEVRDTGSGIPAEELPHIFERFHRVEGTRGRTQEGTGIGLALVRELVRLHGGEISARSSSTEGSSFRVRIPTGSAHLPKDAIGRRRVVSPTALGAAPYVEEALRWLPGVPVVSGGDRTPPRPPSAPTSAGRTRPARVLLADDNADMRDYVSRLLAEHYETEAVGDGEAALTAARARAPDLILADVMMPALDGFGLLRALRADPATRELPILLLSARAGEEARIEGMEAGADDYLVKPFSARELLARVGSHLEIARIRRAARERERELRERAEAARIEAELVGTRLREQAKELDEARERAEEANRTKATFLATMSHELRTPLNAIMGYAELLEAEIAGALTTGQRTQIERIHLGASHLLKIIEEILTFSRIEAGREEVRLEEVDLTSLTLETCRLVEPLAAQKGLGFTCHAPERLSARTDPGKVRQILLNLLSNAIKFTERGEVRLDLSSGRGKILFAVRDTGSGIAPNQQERIFEPFHQAGSPGAHPLGGTGLGLSVSRELALLLGGDIDLQSTVGNGSTFTLHLPARASSKGRAKRSTRRTYTPAPAEPSSS
jgi:signal transduction histidine kinase